MENGKTVFVLNSLIDILRGDIESLKRCAESMENIKQKNFFQARTRDCEEIICELEAVAGRYGIHSGANGCADFSKTYGKALQEDVPNDLRPLVDRSIRRILIG